MAQNAALIKNIFYYLQTQLFGADADHGEELLTRGQFGVMMTPGQFVNPTLQENEGSFDMWSQWDLLNECLDTSFAYKPLITTITRQYRDALENVALPNRPLTPAEQAELDALGNWIVAHLPQYEVYRDRYYDAFIAYEQERTKQSPNQAILQMLEQKMHSAYQNWDNPVLGEKTLLEDKQALAWSIMTGNPARRWIELNQKLTDNRRLASGREYWQTFLMPPVSAWSNAAWATFQKTITDTETHHYSKSTSWSGGFGATWGLFNSITFGASGEKIVTHDLSDVTTINVTFEYIRVRVQRPWLETDIFASRSWTWKAPTAWHWLSTGGNLQAPQPERPIGTMPFLSTHLAVVRNVMIQADFSHNDQQTIYSKISGSVTGGFGFFSVRGSYSEETQQVDVRATFDGTTVRIPNPQIVGYLGTLLPRTPDPDPQIKPYFPPTAVWPPEQVTAEMEEVWIVREAERERLRKRIAFAEKEAELCAKLREALDVEWENINPTP